MLAILAAVILVGWTAAAIIGTQAYFRGEQSKPIHERNWRSTSFEQIAKSVTGTDTDYSNRVASLGLDAYTSQNLPN